ncbi:DUF1570 domain-containing protein, partial [Singulisphaera rosea]
GQSLVPTRHVVKAGPYAVYSNFPIPADAPAIRSLKSLEADLGSRLGIRVDSEEPPVEVYILNDRPSFDHFLKYYYPELPSRRAFFLAQGSQRVVFTFMGNRLEEDLRHEATHALLNVVYGDMPLWLDEGLAEYFEVPNGRQGVNSEHLTRLPSDLASGWKPDLPHLETLRSVRDMSPRDYRESWAWVHYLLNDSKPGKATLLNYMADYHKDPRTLALSARLRNPDGNAPREMVAHLDHVKVPPLVAANSAPTTPDAMVRLQDNSSESSRPTNQKRSFFGRMLEKLGL